MLLQKVVAARMQWSYGLVSGSRRTLSIALVWLGWRQAEGNLDRGLNGEQSRDVARFRREQCAIVRNSGNADSN